MIRFRKNLYKSFEGLNNKPLGYHLSNWRKLVHL